MAAHCSCFGRHRTDMVDVAEWQHDTHMQNDGNEEGQASNLHDPTKCKEMKP